MRQQETVGKELRRPINVGEDRVAATGHELSIRREYRLSLSSD